MQNKLEKIESPSNNASTKNPWKNREKNSIISFFFFRSLFKDIQDYLLPL